MLQENNNRKRPSWDDFFMSLVEQAAKRSACIPVPCAAVFVDQDHHLISFGYSGPTRGDFHCREAGICLKIDGDPITGEIKRCNGAHAEMNAIANSGDTMRLKGATLYSTFFPCYDCMKILNNVGVKRIVYKKVYERLIDGGNGKTEGVEKEALELAHKRGIILEKYELLDEKRIKEANRKQDNQAQEIIELEEDKRF